MYVKKNIVIFAQFPFFIFWWILSGAHGAIIGAIPPIHHPQKFLKNKYGNVREKNIVIFAQFPFFIFWWILSCLARNFPVGVIIGLVPKMLERSPVNFNSKRISDSGKTVS